MQTELKEPEIDRLLLAQKVKAKRVKKRWGYRRVGISAGVSHMSVKRLEQGSKIHKRNVEALAKWAGLTTQDITTGQTHLKL
jgi:hypothetical protein